MSATVRDLIDGADGAGGDAMRWTPSETQTEQPAGPRPVARARALAFLLKQVELHTPSGVVWRVRIAIPKVRSARVRRMRAEYRRRRGGRW